MNIEYNNPWKFMKHYHESRKNMVNKVLVRGVLNLLLRLMWKNKVFFKSQVNIIEQKWFIFCKINTPDETIYSTPKNGYFE